MYPVKNYSEHSFCGIMSSFILYFICREMAKKLLILLLISLFTVPHLLPSAYSFLFPPSDQALPLWWEIKILLISNGNYKIDYNLFISKGSNLIFLEEKEIYLDTVKKKFAWKWKYQKPHIPRSMLAFFSYSHDAKVEISIHPHF